MLEVDSIVPAIETRLRGEPTVPSDDQLALILLACHPALNREARVALTLKTVCGFSVGEIARALLSTEQAITQRLVRAKRRLREPDVRFEINADEQPERLDSALDVIYLLFNEGYAAHAGHDLVRHELCAEAIRLATALAADPALASPGVHALLALMLLQAARFATRMDEGPDLQRLEEQDRSRWDSGLIDRGLRHLDRAASGDRLTAYHLEAEIAACHAVAVRFEATDWEKIAVLYDYLLAMKPTPVVGLNRAIAISRTEGAAAGLDALRSIASDETLARYYLLHATLGQLTLDTGDRRSAAEHFRAALACDCSVPERRFLERQFANCKAKLGR
jgi:RNA polymerase sigma-70 factor (ECF subfamily)